MIDTSVNKIAKHSDARSDLEILAAASNGITISDETNNTPIALIAIVIESAIKIIIKYLVRVTLTPYSLA